MIASIGIPISSPPLSPPPLEQFPSERTVEKTRVTKAVALCHQVELRECVRAGFDHLSVTLLDILPGGHHIRVVLHGEIDRLA